MQKGGNFTNELNSATGCLNYARLKTIQLKQPGKLVLQREGSWFNVFLFSEDMNEFCNSVCTARQRLNSKVGNNRIVQMIFKQCDEPGFKKTKRLAIKVRIGGSPVMKNVSIPATHAWTICLSQWEPSEIKHWHWFFFFFLSTQFICTFQWGSQRPWFAITLDKCEPVSTDRWFGHSTFQRPLNTIHVWVWNKSNCSNKLSHGHQSEKLTFIFPFLLRVSSQCISWEIANLWLISVIFFFSFFLLLPLTFVCVVSVSLEKWSAVLHNAVALNGLGSWFNGEMRWNNFCFWQFERNADLERKVKTVRVQLRYSKLFYPALQEESRK